MGWGGYDPWAGDSPADLAGTATDYFQYGLLRALGFSSGSKGLDAVGDHWCSRLSWSTASTKRKTANGYRWSDPMDEWSLVGAIALALNRHHCMLDVRVVKWAAIVCRELRENEEWIKTWKSPTDRRRSLTFFAKQFEKLVATTVEREQRIRARSRPTPRTITVRRKGKKVRLRLTAIRPRHPLVWAEHGKPAIVGYDGDRRWTFRGLDPPNRRRAKRR